METFIVIAALASVAGYFVANAKIDEIDL